MQNSMKWEKSILKSAGKSSPAFTLIEVLIALTILAVGFLAVAKMQITGLMSNQHAMVLTEGITYAQDRMETLMGLPYDDMLLASTGGSPRSDESAPEGYTIEWEVTNDSPTEGSKLVVLTGKWRNRFGFTQSINLTGVKNSF